MRDEDEGVYPSRIIYEYEGAENCPLFYAHGVWGGVNAHGEVEMNLYMESDKLPRYSEREVRPDGSVGPETPALEEDAKVVVRTILAKVVLSRHSTRALIDWLEEKARILDMEEQAFSMGGPDGGPAQ